MVTTGPSRTEALNGQFGLKLRTEGYSWFCQHKQDRNVIKINKIQGYKTLLKDVAALWVVPSSNTKEDNFKIFAKKRFALRQDPSVATNFEEFVQIRSSCWIIEEKGGQYYCDCYFGIKGKLCKHTVGLMYKTKVLTETEDVRSVPLGRKRKPGRPKKEGRNFPHCLTTSPAPAPVPVSRYWRSPEVPENLSLSPHPGCYSEALYWPTSASLLSHLHPHLYLQQEDSWSLQRSFPSRKHFQQQSERVEREGGISLLQI